MNTLDPLKTLVDRLALIKAGKAENAAVTWPELFLIIKEFRLELKKSILPRKVSGSKISPADARELQETFDRFFMFAREIDGDYSAKVEDAKLGVRQPARAP